jgi:selenocysteine-specific elongation factor
LPTRLGALIERPLGPKRTVRVLADDADDLEERVLRALGRLHAARPRLSAIPRAHLSAELPDLANDALAAGLIDRLSASGRLVSDSRTVAIPRYEAKLSQGERKLKNELAESIRLGGISPPDVAALAATAGARAAAVPDLLALLRDEHRIVEINTGLYLDVETEAELRRKVTARLADGSAIAMSELRDALGTTRRYAVPIGEYLDRIGLTKRESDTRRLGPAARPARVAAP